MKPDKDYRTPECLKRELGEVREAEAKAAREARLASAWYARKGIILWSAFGLFWWWSLLLALHGASN